MRIAKDVIDKLRGSQRLKYELALQNECHPITVERWIMANNHGGMLTTYDNLNLLSKELNLKLSELVEDEAPIITKNINR